MGVGAPVDELKAEFFETLAHPARIRIVEVLRAGDHSVSELIPKVGLEASHLSHQLSVLRRGTASAWVRERGRRALTRRVCRVALGQRSQRGD